jgi:hypothetical protein
MLMLAFALTLLLLWAIQSPKFEKSVIQMTRVAMAMANI